MTAQTMVGTFPAHLIDTTDVDRARRDYLDVITRAIVDHPRSQQRAIGPSEVGDPCARKIGYKLLGTPERPQQPAWRPTVGTAVHAWLEDAFDKASVASLADLDGHERWLVETRVTAAFVPELEPLTGQLFLDGSCDLFDRVTATSIDHKAVGPGRLKKYRASRDPGQQYRAQAHLYGLGWANRGERVDTVAVCFLTRDGDLSDAWWWSEPFDRALAEAAVERLRGIAVTVGALGGAGLTVLPTADSFCSFCPFFKPGAADLSQGCPGHKGVASARVTDQLAGLIGGA